MPSTSIVFNGYFTSADARALSETNGRFTLYTNNKETGAPEAVTLEATDVVEITDIIVCASLAGVAQVYDGSNNAVGTGEQLAIARTATAAPNVVVPLVRPVKCQPGTYPKLINSVTGQIDAMIFGTIKRRFA